MDIQGLTTATGTNTATTKGFGDLKTEDFVKILVSQLQSQNPLQPLDSGQLIDQIGAINSLQSTGSLNSTLLTLTETLSNQGLAQSLGAASGLIGKTVSGTVDGADVTGVVDKAVVDNGGVLLVVGENRLPISDITEIV